MDLFEWTQHYIKFRDVMKRAIVDMKVQDPWIHVEEKNSEKKYYISEDISRGLDNIQKGTSFLVVCANRKKNIDILVERWKEVSENKEITIIFANPESNESWLIHPATHHGIADSKSLKDGLLSLFKGVQAY